MKAAVLHEPHTPLEIVDVSLDEPGPYEVKVKIVAVGVCQTDLHPIEGQGRWPLPAVLGHEGAGIVESVGPGVINIVPGDHVVLTVLTSCGTCKECVSGKPYHCTAGYTSWYKGTLMSGSKPIYKDRKRINSFFSQSSFAEYVVVDNRTAIKVRREAPLDKICILACGAMTGIGGVVNTAKVEPGSSVAIFGCGGVGLSAILGARLVSAAKIIAVDMLDKKLIMANELGATHSINASKQDPIKAIIEITDGGADYAFEAVGKSRVMEQAYASIKQGGKAVILGAATPGDTMTIDPYQLIAEKVLMGSTVGSVNPSFDIPRFVDLFMNGMLPLDKLVSHTFDLDQINDAIKVLVAGEAGRIIININTSIIG